jgi:glycosyltransferase involved in cell wall biosynthesis
MPSKALRRLLLVSPSFPSDIRRAVYGFFQRTRMLLEAAQAVSEEIELLYYVPDGQETSSASCEEAERLLESHWKVRARVSLCPRARGRDRNSRWSDYVSPALSVYRQSPYSMTSGPEQVAALEASLERKPDAVLVHRLCSMPPLLHTRRPLPAVYLDLDDVEHVKLLRDLGQPPFWPGKLLYYLQLPVLFLAEARATRLAAKSFVCSEHDRRYLEGMRLFGEILTISNGVHMPTVSGDGSSGKALLLLGTYGYGPNASAADHLIRRIWPAVRRRVPDSRLIIAGGRPDHIAAFRESPPAVEFTGFVEDLDALYRRVRIAVAPIQYGGGTRVKIIEAAAYGKAIVATRLGAEGLDFEDGKEILLRDDPDQFAEACAELLNDPDRCRRLGGEARRVAAARYDRERIIQRIREALTSARANPATAGGAASRSASA